MSRNTVDACSEGVRLKMHVFGISLFGRLRERLSLVKQRSHRRETAGH